MNNSPEIHKELLSLATTQPAGRRKFLGFSLIELMVVLAIVAILATIAYPSYREHIVKTRRAEGRAGLLAMSTRLERCFTENNHYDNECASIGAAAPSEHGWYQISATSLTATAFTLSAVPQQAQAIDDTSCGTLTLTNTGAHSQSSSPPAGYSCW